MLSDFEFEKLSKSARVWKENIMNQTLSATDVLAPISMKNAAKCDTSCELQNQWVIKTLNATCTSFGEYVCSSVCSSPPKKHPPGVLSESTVWSHSFGVECVQMEWMSNPFKLLKVMIISLVTILKPSNLRHHCQKFRMCLLKRDWSKSPFKILIGPRISQEYPLNLSI